MSDNRPSLKRRSNVVESRKVFPDERLLDRGGDDPIAIEQPRRPARSHRPTDSLEDWQNRCDHGGLWTDEGCRVLLVVSPRITSPPGDVVFH
jgi:hypothetical protein